MLFSETFLNKDIFLNEKIKQLLNISLLYRLLEPKIINKSCAYLQMVKAAPKSAFFFFPKKSYPVLYEVILLL